MRARGRERERERACVCVFERERSFQRNHAQNELQNRTVRINRREREGKDANNTKRTRIQTHTHTHTEIRDTRTPRSATPAKLPNFRFLKSFRFEKKRYRARIPIVDPFSLERDNSNGSCKCHGAHRKISNETGGTENISFQLVSLPFRRGPLHRFRALSIEVQG